jgi:hypothetical protein
MSRRGTYAPGRDDYLLYDVERVSHDGSEIALTATFRATETYCCMELICHFSPRPSDWAALRAVLAEHGLRPDRIALRPRWRVEEGARIGLRFPGDTRTELEVLPADQGEYDPFVEPPHPGRGSARAAQ